MKLLPHIRSTFKKEQTGLMQDTTDGLSSFSANRRTLLLAITPSGCTRHTLQQDSSPYQAGVYPMHYNIKDSRHFLPKQLIFRSLMQKWHSYCCKTNRLSWLPVWPSRKKDLQRPGSSSVEMEVVHGKESTIIIISIGSFKWDTRCITNFKLILNKFKIDLKCSHCLLHVWVLITFARQF